MKAHIYVLTMIAVASTGAGDRATFRDPTFRFEQVDVIYVLPTVDLTGNEDKHMGNQPVTNAELQAAVDNRALKLPEEWLEVAEFDMLRDLKERRFRTVPKSSKAQDACVYKTVYYRGLSTRCANEFKRDLPLAPTRMQISETDLKGPQEAWIRKLGPEEARWVFLLAVEDPYSHMNFGSASGLVIGMLFDRQQGKLVWSSFGLGGVAVQFSIGANGTAATHAHRPITLEGIVAAVDDLNQQIDKQKRRK